ncbi:uncharacterized protein LOC114285768 [Camellia sinensis]|uniref:uncharacterized protein LOC114285768 n=1 Tax=Camellia sinensis TaxID=4442 RepID=UPI001036999B|nr:uncharacterized protein LOC114285768 [Camellia sinensis]
MLDILAAAAVARALAGLPPHQRYSLPSSSEELSSIYGSKPHGQVVEELEEEFYEEDLEPSNMQSSSSRLTYSDLCHQIPESKFRQCLLTTLAALFKLMSSYQAVMSFQLADKVMTNQEAVECIRNIKDAKAAAKHLTC